jgi:hypothetical protein
MTVLDVCCGMGASAFTKISALGVEEQQRVKVRVDFLDPLPPGKELGDRYRAEPRCEKSTRAQQRYCWRSALRAFRRRYRQSTGALQSPGGNNIKKASRKRRLSSSAN